MKPAWDQLMAEYKDSTTSLIADVDCTTDGKPLCEKHGVQGFPTIKYGDVTDLQDYSGGRSFDDLKKFASENLGPTCGPANLDLCSSKDKAKIEGFMKMAPGALEEKIQKAKQVVEVEVPIMQKVLASKAKGKTDL